MFEKNLIKVMKKSGLEYLSNFVSWGLKKISLPIKDRLILMHFR
jgi:hypothetical protein